jgi:transposase
MDKRLLEECLAQGMSLKQIGELTGKHLSTVGYHVKVHGLKANGSERHSPKRKVDPDRLRELAAAGATLQELCEEFATFPSSVRYWLRKLDIETDEMRRKRQFEEAREAGARRVYANCRTHGRTAFFKRPDGGYRCARCNSEAVAKRRRKVKRILLEEAGGKCALCGFNEYPCSLQFHHLDPTEKSFALSRRGVTRSIAEARREAAKCVLLCANCHAAVEAGLVEIPEVAVDTVEPELPFRGGS